MKANFVFKGLQIFPQFVFVTFFLCCCCTEKFHFYVVRVIHFPPMSLVLTNGKKILAHTKREERERRVRGGTELPVYTNTHMFSPQQDFCISLIFTLLCLACLGFSSSLPHLRLFLWVPAGPGGARGPSSPGTASWAPRPRRLLHFPRSPGPSFSRRAAEVDLVYPSAGTTGWPASSVARSALISSIRANPGSTWPKELFPRVLRSWMRRRKKGLRVPLNRAAVSPAAASQRGNPQPGRDSPFPTVCRQNINSLEQKHLWSIARFCFSL